ncbi:MAG: c-type cytochrome biogenesis protein CcmI [Burkholderiales bacterium]
MFWLIAALMVLLALGFLLLPLARQRTLPKNDSRTVNIALYRDQLSELRGDLKSGSLSDDQYREAVSELERNLVEDVTPPTGTPASTKKNRTLIAALTASVSVFAIALYFVVGSPQSLSPPTLTVDRADMLVQQLAQHLEENPDSAEGWTVLARAYHQLGRYDKAAAAFERAGALKPDDAQLFADFADSLALANGGRLDGKPAALLAKSLAADPANVKALALSGAHAYGAGNYQLAAEYWQRLLARIPEGSEQAKLVQERIAEARARATADSRDTADIRGTVKLSPHLKNQVAPDDTLFVYAQADNSRMPLAIVRARAKELPYSFVLDDSKGMASGVKLSTANEVRVVARISKSGQAKSTLGDLQGVTARVKPGASGVEVVIDQMIGVEANK